MSDELTRLPGARERILRTADDLFYAEGIHAVGVDRVTAESGVAKATLYQQFRSKDELVAACLQRRAEHWRRSVAEPVLALSGSASRRVGAVFVRLGEAFAAPGYRGCPFINAAAEYPGPDGPVAAAIAAHRAQVRGLFAELLAGLPAARRAALTDQLVLLYDGTMVARPAGPGTECRAPGAGGGPAPAGRPALALTHPVALPSSQRKDLDDEHRAVRRPHPPAHRVRRADPRAGRRGGSRPRSRR